MMNSFITLLASFKPDSFIPVAAGMMVTGFIVVIYSVFSGRTVRSDVQKRLRIDIGGVVSDQTKGPMKKEETAKASRVLKRAQDKAQEFYSKSDPESLIKLRGGLMQAGFLNPSAAGLFLSARVISLIIGVGVGVVLVSLYYGDDTALRRWSIVIGSGGMGYFFPNLVLWKLTKNKLREYRNGFPDFMDLMIVCADAGMSLEAAIERVAREITKTYPSLSQNLQLLTIELRAGRSLDDSMKSLSERLGLDEVRSFSTLLQQSREMGTSLSGALRVFSDEMRHKRMSLAEEKAHMLPAKMSVPVTMCILPVVMLIAVIPVIVKLSAP